MKTVLAVIAMITLVGFVGFTRAEDAPKPKVHKGVFVKVDNNVVTYHGGVKGKGKEYTIKIDDSTKVTLDGKDAKIADIKGDTYIEITETKGTASAITALTTPPAPKPAK